MPRSFPSHSDDVGPYRVVPADREADPIPDALYDVLQSPSLFGRILLITAIRSSAMDAHDAVDPHRSHTPEIELALERLHLEMFMSWLVLPLQRQKADIGIYLNAGPAADRGAKIQQLAVLGERALPLGSKRPERELFVRGLKIVRALLNYDK
jgi:hypothetical protein